MFLHFSPESCPMILVDLINQCTKIPSKERPTFTNILQQCKQNTKLATTSSSETEFWYHIAITLCTVE